MSRFDEMSGTMAHSSGPECVSESADTSALGNMGGQTEAQMQFDPFGNAGKSLRACRHLKRELLSQINNLLLALQKADHDDFELQNKFAYLEREVGRFDNYLNENVALEHQEGFREQVFKEFENLKCKFEQVDELSNCQINPEDSVSNVTENTRLTSSSSIALAQVDLQLEKKKLAIKAQMELEEARLEAKLEKLKFLSRSREGSKTGSRFETKSIGTSTKSRDSLYSIALSSSSPQMAKKSPGAW